MIKSPLKTGEHYVRRNNGVSPVVVRIVAHDDSDVTYVVTESDDQTLFPIRSKDTIRTDLFISLFRPSDDDVWFARTIRSFGTITLGE